MIADSHIHLFANGYPGIYGTATGPRSEVAAYEAIRAVRGVGAALVVGYEGGAEFAGNNQYILRLSKTRPWIHPLCYVPPAAAPNPLKLRRWIGRGARGISLYLPLAEDARAVAAWPTAIWQELGTAAAIVSLNASPAAARELAQVIARAEGCFFLFSHLGMPGRQTRLPSLRQAAQILRPLLALARLPNTGVKVSALYAVSPRAHGYPHPEAAPFLDLLLETFGPMRLFWGSDFFPAAQFVSFPQTIESVRAWLHSHGLRVQGVCGENLERILGLQHKD